MNLIEQKIDPKKLVSLTKSDLMKDIYSKLSDSAKIDSNILLIGEQGTGKKIAARMIHKESVYSSGPFYNFFCSAVKNSSFREEFQGRIQIDQDKLKIKHQTIEEAKGGVLFLENFTDLSLQNQIYIAELISSIRHKPKDESSTKKLKVVISIDKEAFIQVHEQNFWTYIMNRLNPVQIWLPPLRVHREDIPPLINLILYYCRDEVGNSKQKKITLRALYKCISFDWPGNISQLENAIVNAMFQAEGDIIRADHLPFSLNWVSWNNHQIIAAEQLKSFKNAERQLLSNYQTESTDIGIK